MALTQNGAAGSLASNLEAYLQTLNSYNIALNGTQGYQGTISSALNTLKDLVMLNCQGKSKPSPVKVPVCEMPNPTSGPSPQPAPSPAPPPPSIPLVVPQLAGGPGGTSPRGSAFDLYNDHDARQPEVPGPGAVVDDDSSETDGPTVDEPIDPQRSDRTRRVRPAGIPRAGDAVIPRRIRGRPGGTRPPRPRSVTTTLSIDAEPRPRRRSRSPASASGRIDAPSPPAWITTRPPSTSAPTASTSWCRSPWTRTRPPAS